MEFVISETELIDAIRLSVRRLDGRLLMDISDGKLKIPTPCVVDNYPVRMPLTFLPASRTVYWGEKNVRLSTRQYDILSLLSKQKIVTFTQLENQIWQRTTSDTAIRKEISRLSAVLAFAGLPFSLSTKQGAAVLEVV